MGRRFPAGRVPAYVACQCGGALLASLLLRWLFPTDVTALGATRPSGPVIQSFVLEAVLTLLLVFVTLSVSTGAKEKGVMAGVAVGAVIALEALFAGPVCGASMNPARSLAPAVVSGRMGELLIYLVAPVLGAGLAVPVWLCVHGLPANAPFLKESSA
jgi:aquaporin Z